jgi:hypothetical protein
MLVFKTKMSRPRAMLAFNGKYRARGWGGANEIIDEDWDDLFAPALVTSTPWEQWEGTGRNNFGTMIIGRDTRPPPPHPWVRPARPEPAPAPLEPALPPLQHNYQDIVPAPTGPPNSVPPSAWREESERFHEWREGLGVAPAPKRTNRRQAIAQAIAAAMNRLKLQEVEPLRPFCYRCGWRQGGPDSWNGTTCKCGIRGEPLRSASGDYFYGRKGNA